MADKICGVYKIVNTVNDKLYVGGSKDIKNRWKQHVDKLIKKMHGNIHLQNAWNKYGQDSFRFEIVQGCDPSVQFEREQFYLDNLYPFDEYGYNIVRQISKQYMSDNYMIKKCEMCGHSYETFSHLSKYCDSCKEKMKDAIKDWWEHWVDERITDRDVFSWGYNSWDDFWESNI